MEELGEKHMKLPYAVCPSIITLGFGSFREQDGTSTNHWKFHHSLLSEPLGSTPCSCEHGTVVQFFSQPQASHTWVAGSFCDHLKQ